MTPTRTYTNYLTIPVLTVLGLGHAPPAATADLDEGLVGYWSFDDGTATDNSGQGHDGVVHGSPAVIQGVRGYALSLDGVDDYIQIPDAPELEPQALTLSAWLRADATTGTAGIIDKRSSDNHRGYVLLLRSWLAAELIIGDGNLQSSGRVDCPPGEWVHLAATYDGAVLQTYLNGRAAAHHAHATTIRYGGSGDLWMGRDIPTPTYYLSGAIDEVRVFSRALDEAEIRQLYEADAAVFNVAASQQPTLANWWMLLISLLKEGEQSVGSQALRRAMTIPKGGSQE